jgi:hypothetical protein
MAEIRITKIPMMMKMQFQRMKRIMPSMQQRSSTSTKYSILVDKKYYLLSLIA